MNMQVGRYFGIFLVVIGGFFGYMAYGMMTSAGMTLRIFTAGPGLAGMGVAMMLFPGGNITASQSRKKEKDPRIVFSEAPPLHLITWVVGFAVGMIAMRLIHK